MATHEHLSERIKSLRDLRSIVRTMKALAVVSIRQYERAAEASETYYATIATGLQVVLRDTAELPSTPARGADRSPVGAIVFGSDYGLCGRFNENIAEHCLARLSELAPNRSIRALSVGARPVAELEAGGAQVETALAAPAASTRIGTVVEQLLHRIEHWRNERGITHVRLFRNWQRTTGRYEAGDMALLPVERGRFPHFHPRRWPGASLPTYSMSRRRLLGSLLRQYFFVTLFRACADSLAAENGARLAAMQAAESNLDQHLEATVGHYRRARQDSITSELLDVVSGFEALAGRSDSQ